MYGKIRGIWKMPRIRLASLPRFPMGSGARALNTKSTQIQKTKSGRRKRIHSTFHLEPGVRVEMERIAG